MLAEIFSFAVNTEMPLDALLAEKFPVLPAVARQIQDVRVRYEKKKKATNSVDFDDLLQKTLLMVQQNERIAEIYRRQFRFILVDEYQDTNTIGIVAVADFRATATCGPAATTRSGLRAISSAASGGSRSACSSADR